jgi:hypothetical protein
MKTLLDEIIVDDHPMMGHQGVQSDLKRFDEELMGAFALLRPLPGCEIMNRIHLFLYLRSLVSSGNLVNL